MSQQFLPIRQYTLSMQIEDAIAGTAYGKRRAMISRYTKMLMSSPPETDQQGPAVDDKLANADDAPVSPPIRGGGFRHLRKLDD